jgi:hypothetical protein
MAELNFIITNNFTKYSKIIPQKQQYNNIMFSGHICGDNYVTVKVRGLVNVNWYT